MNPVEIILCVALGLALSELVLLGLLVLCHKAKDAWDEYRWRKRGGLKAISHPPINLSYGTFPVSGNIIWRDPK